MHHGDGPVPAHGSGARTANGGGEAHVGEAEEPAQRISYLNPLTLFFRRRALGKCVLVERGRDSFLDGHAASLLGSAAGPGTDGELLEPRIDSGR